MSKSLDQKIAGIRRVAPQEVPKARLCAEVILAAGEDEMQLALTKLKKSLGNNWSTVTAMQFMSGRRGALAAECAPPLERPRLQWAHLVSKKVCSDHGLGGVSPPDNAEVAHFFALITAAQRYVS
jgi:hypothetical protein